MLYIYYFVLMGMKKTKAILLYKKYKHHVYTEEAALIDKMTEIRNRKLARFESSFS